MPQGEFREDLLAVVFRWFGQSTIMVQAGEDAHIAV